MQVGKIAAFYLLDPREPTLGGRRGGESLTRYVSPLLPRGRHGLGTLPPETPEGGSVRSLDRLIACVCRNCCLTNVLSEGSDQTAARVSGNSSSFPYRASARIPASSRVVNW